MDGSAKMIVQSVQFGAQHPDGNICCSSPAISVKMISFGLDLQLWSNGANKTYTCI